MRLKARNILKGLAWTAKLAPFFMASALAAGTLEGRLVTFHTMTWDDPEAPYLSARGKTVTVGAGVEFGLSPEGLQGGLDVVPAEVEIGPNRIEVSYLIGAGQFYEAVFNGYVLRFEGECALFESVTLDSSFTTMPLTEADIFTEGAALYINVSAMEFGPDQRLALDLTVADCPIS